MPCVSGCVEALGQRKRLEHRDDLVFTKDESPGALHLTYHVHHFGFGNGDDIMRKNLNVLFRDFGFHDLL